MVNFLLVFSIALNILALLCIALLFIRQNRLAAFESRQEKALEEMEEIVSMFIAEIKEENELFLQRIHQLDDETEQNSREESAEEKDNNDDVPITVAVTKINPYKAAVESYQTFESDKKSDDVDELLDLILPQNEVPSKKEETETAVEEKKEKTLLDEVTELEQQGKTIEQIAKKLNKGKTEIELLLKFRQNNQE